MSATLFPSHGASPIDRELGESIWDMLERVAGVDSDPLLKEDLLNGLESAVRNEVSGRWQGLDYTGLLWYDQGLRFAVAAKGERALERRRHFKALEDEVNLELKRLVPVYRPYQLSEMSESRLRPSGLS